MAQAGSSASIWKQSPYTMFRENDVQDEQDEQDDQDDSEQEEPDVNEEERVHETRQNYFPPVIFSEPPPGYFTEFEAENTEEEKEQFNEHGSLLTDTSTAIGRMSQLVTTDPAISIRNKEVKQQSKLGAKFLDSVTKVPLSNFWHRITQVFAILIFATNVASAIYDLVHDPVNLHYKVPNIFFGVVANILLIAWFKLRPNVLKSGTGHEDGKKKEDKNTNTTNTKKKKKADKEKEDKKKEEENEKHKKYQQYAENIMHEALLYPIIVLSVFGFANDKMYKIETEWFSMLQFVLIVIDAIDVLWTQIMRIIMIKRFLQDMKTALGVTVEDIGMNILRRGIITTITNFVLFVFLILLLGAQVHTDNFNNKDNVRGYRGSVNSTFLLIAVITLPLFNLVVFIAVNYHWVVELLLVLGAESKKGRRQEGCEEEEEEDQQSRIHGRRHGIGAIERSNQEEARRHAPSSSFQEVHLGNY